MTAVTRSLSHYKFSCPEFFYPANEFFFRCVTLLGRNDIRLLDISFDRPFNSLKSHLISVVKGFAQTPKWSQHIVPLFCLISEMSDVSLQNVQKRQPKATPRLVTKRRRKGAPMHHGHIKGPRRLA